MAGRYFITLIFQSRNLNRMFLLCAADFTCFLLVPALSMTVAACCVATGAFFLSPLIAIPTESQSRVQDITLDLPFANAAPTPVRMIYSKTQSPVSVPVPQCKY